ncbi:hypothetical protein GCM10017776_16480 [Streptomyces griseoluteus]|nr:hypothetical protein GCM10017776_16480 [Streptomyces griseoluteus]
MTMTQQTTTGQRTDSHHADPRPPADDTRKALSERLDQLKRDEHAGMEQLRRLVEQQSSTREALLRISGAIQVLEDLLHPADAESRRANSVPPP